MSEEVSTDKATWQPSMAATIRIHQCRGLCLKFVHIIDHRIACVMYWLSGLYGLFHYVASRSGVPLDVFSPCGVSRHPPSARPRVVPCGGTFVPWARSRVLWWCARDSARQGRQVIIMALCISHGGQARAWSAAKPVRMG